MAEQQEKLAAMVMLKALAAQMGVDVVPKATGKKRKRTAYKSTPAAPAGQAKPKTFYGKAPTTKRHPGQTHQERVAALEAAIPGITNVAYIFSVGKDVKGKLTKSANHMVNTPFTCGSNFPMERPKQSGNLTRRNCERR